MTLNPDTSAPDLSGKVALVAGATRGAGRAIAVQLGAAGATVYVTGRTTRERRSEYNRAETIEDTADLVTAAGGTGIAVPTDHLEPDQVRALAERIDAEQGRVDVLVNDVWGGERLFEFDKPVWEHDLDNGLRLMRLGVATHAITSHFVLPLLVRRPGGLVIEMTDGTSAYNGTRYRNSYFYDLVKNSVLRMAFVLAHELKPHGGTAVALSPGWMRSEMMLDTLGVTEDTWRDALTEVPHFCISESPAYVGRAVAALAGDADVARWNGESVSSGQLAQEYGFTDLDGSRPDCWRYLVEVEETGKPADASGYR
ncbi:SDR family oxidoreductase [Streptomyces sp. NP-1717]|uniref:SDR family oxidoreductase n=1 Tax=unclassified Streptomyces TaxID=2593676 RepID=UPI001F5C4D36|nr:SDR family oxidoreductase [Streptomyces sp. NP-1717]MCI3221148.1 SDR family oxidoreductase [Streptomyces sp. NP-1717]WTA72224.1 SDR family oxidoreductase [Streptomyces sp. NBC_00838]